MSNPTTIRMNFEGNRGYGADQVESISLGELATLLDQALADYGEDAQVVLHQSNNGYGANFGQFSRWMDLFTAEDGEEDEEY